MLRAAIAFFVLALLAMVLGASGVAGVSMEIGKTLLVVFLVLAAISFVASLLTGKRTGSPLGVLFALGAAVAAGGSLVACASAEKAAEEVAAAPSQETQNAAVNQGASFAKEVVFEKNSAVLTDGGRSAIRDMVKQAAAAGEIDEVKVVAWADREIPASKNAKLSDAEIRLAADRAKAIESFIANELKVDEVETHNMAERPNAFQELFETEDKEVKDAMAKYGVKMNGEGIAGKASRAVVMAIMDT